MRKVKLFCLAVLLSLGVVATIQALPVAGWEEEYYDDDTFVNQVGYRYVGCTGSPVNDGIRTNYVLYYSWDCSTLDYTECEYMLCTTFPNGQRSCSVQRYCWY